MTETKVSWLPWSEESFRKAKELDKPILLSISAVWCHWCHVMDQTTYSDSEVARLIEEKFVPIRVDRDQRPDIDKRYNMGGWPSTAFLTPDGEILSGGTYIPPEHMKALLEHISSFYQKNKNNIKSRIDELEKEMEKPSVEYGLGSEVFHSVIDGLTLEIASLFDSLHGGFGNSPKFPHSNALRLALLQHHLQGHEAALNIVKKTLTEMRNGGIYDDEEGGFFRYSTTRDWSVPHYEKMCEDNAKLLVNYLEAYQVTGERLFRDTAKGIVAYVKATLSNQENGGFYGSQDADEAYYNLRLPERVKRTPPRVDKRLFVNWNCMMSSAYLLASVVLDDRTLQDFALRTVNLLLDKSCSPENGVAHYIMEGESHLFGLLTDQVHMMECLIDCYQLTLDRNFLSRAENIAGFIMDKLWSEAGGFYDKPRATGGFGALNLLDKPLEENSVAADALLRLHYLTGKQKCLEAARRTLEVFASGIQRYCIMGCDYGLAAELYLHPMQVHIVGSRKDYVTRRFLAESLRAYNPLKVVEVIDPDVDSERLKRLGYPVADVPTAYVCSEGTCNLVEDPKKMGKAVRQFGGKDDGN
ncbi:MAG TPA: thioredoxin domain-containing protein [Candidatus Bathyarchaeota archaeon]|nr:thioredoxin domain-containing protein [Candidatus Bathyarchaeota archaeon]